MKEYTESALSKRNEISALHTVGEGPTRIARIIDVHRTTISRELKWNIRPSGYYKPLTYAA